jgi:hypothetical protein
MAMERRSSRESKGRSSGYLFPKSANKSRPSLDLLVWPCRETPDRKPREAFMSRHKYEMLEFAMPLLNIADRMESLKLVFLFFHE